VAFSFAIDTSGSAFDEYPRQEIARIMREHADRIEQGVGPEGVCRDRDGSVVGMWRLVGCGSERGTAARAVGELFIGPAVWSGPEGFEQVVKTNTRGAL